MVNRQLLHLLILVIICFSFFRTASVASIHISSPFDIGYESPQLSTIKAIKGKRNIYDKSIFNEFPFVLTMYTPAYFYLVSFLPQSTDNIFYTGRVVSMVFMILSSLCLFSPFKPSRKIMISILAIACFFLVNKITSHTAYLRNDSMGLFFSVFAVILSERARGRPFIIVLVSLLSFIAFTCKQSFLVAAASCFFYFFLNNRKDALFFIISLSVSFIGFSLFAQLYWGDGFWFSTFVVPRNPILLDVFLANWKEMLYQPYFIIFILITFSTFSAFFIREKEEMFKSSPYTLYLLFSLLALFLTVGKIGASVNYFFETVLACLLMIVYAVKKYDLQNKKPRIFSVVILLLISCVLYESIATPESEYSLTTSKGKDLMLEHINQVNNEIKDLMHEDGEILNLGHIALAFEVQENPVLNDPSLYSVLWSTNTLSVNPFIKLIVEQRFKLIILGKKPVDNENPETTVEYIDRAILAFYRIEKFGKYYYLTPKRKDNLLNG